MESNDVAIADGNLLISDDAQAMAGHIAVTPIGVESDTRKLEDTDDVPECAASVVVVNIVLSQKLGKVKGIVNPLQGHMYQDGNVLEMSRARRRWSDLLRTTARAGCRC